MNDLHTNLLEKVGAQITQCVEFAKRKDTLSAEESLDLSSLKLPSPIQTLTGQIPQRSIFQDT